MVEHDERTCGCQLCVLKRYSTPPLLSQWHDVKSLGEYAVAVQVKLLDNVWWVGFVMRDLDRMSDPVMGGEYVAWMHVTEWNYACRRSLEER